MDFYQKINLTEDKVLFVGDIHFNSVPPLSRIDDYSQACIKKMENIKQLCIEKDYKLVIFTGDIFHRTLQPFSYMYQVISSFEEFHKSKIKAYTIFGNHDLPYEKVENIVKTPLGVLLQTNYLKPFNEINLLIGEGKVCIKGIHYPDDIPKSEVGGLNICVAHRFYNYSFSESTLKKVDIKNLGYDYYILGHDHVPYNDIVEENQVIVRPGALLRGTKHEYNLSREIFVEGFKFSCVNRIEVIKERYVIKSSPAEEVFSTQAFSPETGKKELEDFEVGVEELISKMDEFGSGNYSVYSILDAIELEASIRSRIEKYLEDCGILRKLNEAM